jgi:hypothetical protein
MLTGSSHLLLKDVMIAKVLQEIGGAPLVVVLPVLKKHVIHCSMAVFVTEIHYKMCFYHLHQPVTSCMNWK